MDKELEHSLKAAKLEFKEEPMDDFYQNTIAGYPSRLRVRTILKELGDLRGKKFFDIGCEAGYVSLRILRANKPSELYAIDICQEAIDSFQKKLDRIDKSKIPSKIVLKKAFLQKIPFKKDSFDAAVCTEVIEHAPQLDKGFSEMSRVLKKGGKLVITFPNEKLRKFVYPIVRMLGVNTDVEKDVTLFERDPKEIISMLKKNNLYTTKFYRIPWYFPITNVLVCKKL